MTTEVIVSVRGVDLFYRSFQALRHFSCAIYAGECVGLLGPNGAGKTTLIRCIVGVLRPTAGEIRVFGRNPACAKERESIMELTGYLPEQAGVYPFLTLTRYLDLFSQLRRSASSRDRRIKELIDLFQLTDVAHKKLATFSKGMQQKAKIAAVLIHAPKLLVLDEPTESLDMEARHDLLGYLADLKRKGCSVLMATHDPDLVEQLCDRIVVIHRGEMRFDGTVDDLKTSVAAKSTYKVQLGRPVAPSELDKIAGSPAILAQVMDGKALVFHGDDQTSLGRVLLSLAERGIDIASVEKLSPSLSAAYVRLLGGSCDEGK